MNVQAASIGNPTVSWGTASGTEVPLFDTDSLTAEVDTTIYPVACALEIGKDHMADSAINVGDIITQNMQARLGAEFDNVIANGSGTNRPTGVFSASGITTVSSAGGAGAAPQVSDYESLIFAVGKQYRSPQYRCAFILNDVSYKRARGIPVNSTSDARRIFGMDNQSYKLFDYDCRIQNDISNAKIAFGALSTYRLYRRQATETEFVTNDWSLTRANKIGILLRSRAGGRIVNANAWAKIVDGQA